MSALPFPLPPPIFAAAIALAFPLSKRRHLRSSISRHLNPTLHTPQWCRLCNGDGFIPCRICNQTGTLSPGGFSKRNTVRVDSLVGTKWTSMEAIGGKWRHFLCVAKKGRNAKDGIAVLSSTCGPVENRVRIEVPVQKLKSRQAWRGGWTTLQDIRQGVEGVVCSACRGECKVMCPRCDGLGQIGL